MYWIRIHKAWLCWSQNFTWNSATLDITNGGLDTTIFDPREMLGLLALRSLVYYKIKQGILQQKLSKYNRFNQQRCCVNSLINL